ncbi:hypothetical protein Pcinc_000862 [Petrolisthes cinctipes]|uniref:Uncharacterized protein n=1 Tax=Petrolisthes cinctipes TaxID=88211 RepID=A0AAE1GL84_PETCI|nr:hypothetical protein Pcinc_000862 [Petrolisthes cinctipes]
MTIIHHQLSKTCPNIKEEATSCLFTYTVQQISLLTISKVIFTNHHGRVSRERTRQLCRANEGIIPVQQDNGVSDESSDKDEELEDTILPDRHTAEPGVDVTSDRTSKDLVEDKTDEEEGINEENSCVY